MAWVLARPPDALRQIIDNLRLKMPDGLEERALVDGHTFIL